MLPPATTRRIVRPRARRLRRKSCVLNRGLFEWPGGSNRKRRRCHTTPAHTKNSEIGLAAENVMAVGDEEAQSHNMLSPITCDKP
jgi:hypothetical protein